MRWYERIVAAHTAVTDQVSHLERMKSPRYFVWQEDGSNDLSAGNNHTEYAVTGFTDLFTPLEFDPWAEELGKSFNAFGISWSLRDIQYEEDTGLTHYTWDWEVPDGLEKEDG